MESEIQRVWFDIRDGLMTQDAFESYIQQREQAARSAGMSEEKFIGQVFNCSIYDMELHGPIKGIGIRKEGREGEGFNIIVEVQLLNGQYKRLGKEFSEGNFSHWWSIGERVEK